jgi:hypothetical protein
MVGKTRGTCLTRVLCLFHVAGHFIVVRGMMGLTVVEFWALRAEFGHSATYGTGMLSVTGANVYISRHIPPDGHCYLCKTSFSRVRRACVGVCALCASE